MMKRSILPHSRFRRTLGGLAVAALATAVFAAVGTASRAAPPPAPAKIEYNRDIRPILNDNCFKCHGFDSASRKADLRLDKREAAIKAGSIVPGKPDKSEMIQRIFSDEPSELMPPPKSHKKLTVAQKDLLKRWVAAGAEYQVHWSFIAPRRPALPEVKNKGWVRNPIDAFILAELEKDGLTPAPEADRRTLARRLSLDLTGLPPAPADVEAFVNDKAPDAYEKYVDRLMSSVQWGEHRGRYWLDAARYADTHGIHFDNYREMWVYRDWVIGAFNRNMPFDQFTIEQLGGDLIPDHTLDQQIASGFNRCNITSNEGGLIPEEYLVLYTRDRTETTSAVWLGLTANCAVCHDHKFDPLTQREFYSMAAFFNNTTQGAMDGNIKDTPPALVVPRTEDRTHWDALTGEMVAVRRQVDAGRQAARAKFDAWLTQAKPDQVVSQLPAGGLKVHAPLSGGTDRTLAYTEDGQTRTVTLSGVPAWQPGHVAPQAYRNAAGTVFALPQAGDFEKDQAFSCGAWVKLAKNAQGGSIVARMDDQNFYRGWDLWVEGNRVGAHVISKWEEDAFKVVSKNPLKPGQWYHVFLTYDGSAKAAGLRLYVNGAVQEVNVMADRLKGSIRTAVPFKVGQRHTSSRLDDMQLQDLRLYTRALPAVEVSALAHGTRAAWLAAKPAGQLSPAEKNELFDWWTTTTDKELQELNARLSKLEQEQAAIKARATVAHVMQERKEMPLAFVLHRGDYDKRRQQVKPSTPDILPPMPAGLPRNRLGFAKWLMQPEQPLTARVTVNRFWQEVFGTGLVRTTGDFGVSGELPSHPELLDWLAVEFREGGWNVKKFFKLLVTSATYRQSAALTPEKKEKDPQNRLLSRGPRFRMDAEMVRDYALAASGLLVRKIGGASVKPYQPDGVWEAVAMIGSNTRDYRRDTGESLYRRSLYTFIKRSAPPASMDIFNAPSREVCTVRRERTDTPLQALVTMNDEQFVEAARHLAQLTLKEGGDTTDKRLDYLTGRLLARTLRPEERKVVQGTLDELLAYYKGHAEDAAKLLAFGESKADPNLHPATLAAWTMLANQLLNLDEVLNK
jgi:hypothetical protein